MTYDSLCKLWDKEKLMFDTKILGKNALNWEESSLYQNDYQCYLEIKKFKDNSLEVANALNSFNGRLENFPTTYTNLMTLKANINSDCIDFENTILKPILECSKLGFDELNNEFKAKYFDQVYLIAPGINKAFNRYLENKENKEIKIQEKEDFMVSNPNSSTANYDTDIIRYERNMQSNLNTISDSISVYHKNNDTLITILDNGLRKISSL